MYGLDVADAPWIASRLAAALVVGAIVGINRGAGLTTIAVLALLTTMVILTWGGYVERTCERWFWKTGAPPRPEDQEH